MPRGKIWGSIAVLISASAGILYFYAIYTGAGSSGKDISSISLNDLDNAAYAALSIPVMAVSLAVISTGFWIGWTILTIKVVQPMPELSVKKSHSRVKALILCLASISLAVILVYGIYTRNFWSLAVPSTLITLVILGAVFWVGIAIISARSTIGHKK